MDWKKVILQLRKAGLNDTKIAVSCGVSQPTITRIRSGEIKQPNYDLGTRLIALLGSEGRRVPPPE